jgi:lipoprotein-anchoring transpeptidase ErfK/SrfK
MARFFVMICVVIFAIFMLVVGAKAEVFITIDKSDQTMYVETLTDTYEWPISTGRKGYNTPSGEYRPYLLKRLHYSKKYDNAPMPWSIFFHEGYAIHATGEVERLGSPASHGCVRLELKNARWLYRLIDESGKENTYIRVIE